LETKDTRVREVCRHVSIKGVRLSSLYSKMGFYWIDVDYFPFAVEFEPKITVIRVNSFVASCVVLKVVKPSY